MTLTAEHVSVLRGRTEIVHDVSFSVSDGQWLMICGPNGAGKSTLLSAVSQELPYTGLVTLDGTDLRRMKPRPLARRMAMLRQLSDLAYAYTVEEVVAMGRYAHRGLLQADSGGAEAVERALQAVQLQDKRRQNILTLSGGERQRMLLAQVLCQEPDVLLLDEPGNHLDLRFQQELFLLISYVAPPGGGTTDYAVDIYYSAVKGEKFKCPLKPGTFMDMMYMPDALRAAVEIMEADPSRLKHRNSFNIASMSFDPEIISAKIKEYVPGFEMEYELDPLRQAIADSWPDSLDDSCAREEWDWKPQYDLDSMTEDMLKNLRIKFGIAEPAMA